MGLARLRRAFPTIVILKEFATRESSHVDGSTSTDSG